MTARFISHTYCSKSGDDDDIDYKTATQQVEVSACRVVVAANNANEQSSELNTKKIRMLDIKIHFVSKNFQNNSGIIELPLPGLV